MRFDILDGLHPEPSEPPRKAIAESILKKHSQAIYAVDHPQSAKFEPWCCPKATVN